MVFGVRVVVIGCRVENAVADAGGNVAYASGTGLQGLELQGL